MCKTTVRTQSQAGKPKLLRDAIAVLSVLFLSATARAQTPSAGPTIRSQVREIVLPVVVTDNHGHHVPRLKASDFQVFEDGQPVRVVSFRTETDGSAAPAAPRSDVARTIPQQPVNVTDPRRTYLVLVDTLHSSFANF